MSTEKILVDGEETEVEVAPITLLCHQGNTNIQVPGRVEIDPYTTVALAKGISQEDWELLRELPNFVECFKTVFFDMEMPARLDTEGMGVKHIVGMLLSIMTCVANGQQPFLRLPESYLHPRYQTGIANLLIKLSGAK